jgi:G3E family GTPase
MKKISLNRIPVYLFFGFFGSGKSTLINKLLESKKLKDTALIINEQGDNDFNNIIFEKNRDKIFDINSGCICCVKKSKIGLTFEKIAKKKNIKQVILETSGISSPEIVTQLLINDYSIIKNFELKKIITVIDPIKALENLNNWQEAEQGVYLANDLIISKRDLVSSEYIKVLENKLKELNFEISYSDEYKATNLLNKNKIDELIINNSNTSKHKEKLISKKIKTIKLEIPLECSYEGVVMWMDLISIFKSDRILRSKSILNINGKPAILESVRQVFHPIRYLKKWPYKNKTNKLFFVCQNDIDIKEIKKSLDCLNIKVKKSSSDKLINVKDFASFKNLFSRQSAYK